MQSPETADPPSSFHSSDRRAKRTPDATLAGAFESYSGTRSDRASILKIFGEVPDGLEEL